MCLSLQIDLNYSPLAGYGKGRVPAPVDVKFERMEDDHNMVYTLRYIPSLPGSYSIDVKVSGNPRPALKLWPWFILSQICKK